MINNMIKNDWTGYKFINYEGLEAYVEQDLGYDKASGIHKAIVRFVNSGCTKECAINNVRTGKVKDPMRGIKLFEWRHSTNYGDFMIIENLGNTDYGPQMVKCKWKDTGSISIYRLEHAVTGQIKDWYKPILFGVAYHGEVTCYEEPWAYQEWKHMLSRCYNINDTHYNSYGGNNVYVDNRWLNYANFVYDIKFLVNYDKKLASPSEYGIDKDFLQRYLPPNTPKVYSKDTCIFMHYTLNSYLRYNSSKEPIKKEHLIKMIEDI